MIADLRAVLGDRVRVDGAERALLRRDASEFDGGSAGPICLGGNTAGVQHVVRTGIAHGRASVVSSRRYGSRRFNRPPVIVFNPVSWRCTIQSSGPLWWRSSSPRDRSIVMLPLRL